MSLYVAIKNIAYKNHKSISSIERDLGFSNGTISKWGKVLPRADRLQAVADYLGTTSTYLLRLSEKKEA